MMSNLRAQLFVEGDGYPKEVLGGILQRAQTRVEKGVFGYEIFDIATEEGKAKAKELKVQDVPTLIFHRIARISGTLNEDFINAAALSLVSNTSRDKSGTLDLPAAEKFKLDVASVFMENQVITKSNSSLFVFLTIPNPDLINPEHIEVLAENRKIFILSNFERGSEEQRAKLGSLGLHENIVLGHIIREDMMACGNLVARKSRPFSSAFFRAKIGGDQIKGKWTALLSDSSKFIKDFYMMLFMASSPVSHDGTIMSGSNRQVAKAKDSMDEINRVLW